MILLWLPLGKQIDSIHVLKCLLTPGAICFEDTITFMCCCLANLWFSKVGVGKTSNSHTGSGESLFTMIWFSSPCLLVQAPPAMLTMCWQVPLRRLVYVSITFLSALCPLITTRFQLQTSLWPMLFPLSEVPSCHSIYMRQEGFLTHSSRTEVKFSIIEILVNTCQHNQPSSGYCRIIMIYGKNHLGPLNHCFKTLWSKRKIFRVMISYILLTWVMFI